MIIFTDSFQTYTAGTQPNRWSGVSNGALTTSTAQVRGSAKQSLNGGGGRQGWYKNVPNQTTYIVGVAMYITGVVTVLTFADTGVDQVSLVVTAAGFLQFYRGGTLLGTSVGSVSFNAWHYLEAKVLVDPAVGTCEVKLDGVSALSLTGQNTRNTTLSQINQIILNDSWNGGLPFNNGSVRYNQDFVILDTTGTVNNNYLGDVSVLARMPSGNGTTNNYTNSFAAFLNSHAYVAGETFKDSNNNVQQCTVAGTSQASGTPAWATTGGNTTTSGGATFVVLGTGLNPGAANWMAVSDNPPDDNSSYVTDATIGDIDRYTFPSIAGSQVFAVAVNLRAEKDDAGTRTIRAAVKSGATLADNGADFALTLSSYFDFQGIFQTDPNTGVAWTVAGVNAAEFGSKTTA